MLCVGLVVMVMMMEVMVVEVGEMVMALVGDVAC